MRLPIHSWIPASAVALIAIATLPTAATASWLSLGNPVCTVGQPQRTTAIAPDGASGAVIAWEDNRNGLRDIYAQRIDSTGAVLWTLDGVAVCTATGNQSDPVATFGHNLGGATIFWTDQRDDATRGAEIYGQRLSGEGVPQWATNGVAMSTDDEQNEVSPVAIVDGKGGFTELPGYIVAYGLLERFNHLNTAVAVQHVNTAGADLWTAAQSGGVRLCSNVESASAPRITSDGVGTQVTGRGAVAVWSDERGGKGNRNIYARRVSSSGVPQWAANGVAVCDTAGNQENPDIVHVGGGNVIAVWRDRRGTDENIYAQKLNSSGVAQWPQHGRPVCLASGLQTSSRVVEDGAGGAIVTWADSRSGVSRIFAQHIDANGASLWLGDGIPMTSPTGAAQTIPAIISAGGGAIVIWIDARNGNNDIYAQRVDANGNLLWGDGGVAVCIASGTQTEHVLISDGTFGGLAAWADFRSGNFDIYANRIFPSGVVDVPSREPEGVGLAFLSSHPATGEVRMRLDLPEPASVAMEVVDPLGRRVQRHAGSRLDAGTHVLRWDGRDDSGAPVAAGVYFVHVDAGTRHLVKRVVQIR